MAARTKRFRSAWEHARSIVWEHRRRLLTGFGLLSVNRLAGFVLPASSKQLIDEVLGKGRTDLLPYLIAAVAIATLVQSSTGFLLSRVLGLAAWNSVTEIRKELQQHVIRLPISFFDKEKSGTLISRIMSDATGLRNLVGTGLVQLAGGLLSAAIGFSVLLYLNPTLTFALSLLLLGFGAMSVVAFSKIRPMYRERARIRAEVTGRLGEALGGIRNVKSYVAEKHEDWVFARGAHRIYRNVRGTITAMAGFSAMTTLLTGLIGILLLTIGSGSILRGEMTLGDFVMYIFFIGLVSVPMAQVASIGTQITEAFAGLDRIRELQQMLTEPEISTGHRRIEKIDGRVEFRGVSFHYTEGAPVLQDVSFEASAGSTTALVGPSGSGKSTLIHLIMGFRRPVSGEILVDGINLEEIELNSYRSAFGAVLQEDFLFDGTIAENIAYSCRSASPTEVREAARLAHCDEFISNFTKGYDTIVGERGVRLSGGQRQRVAIARAILARPRILILDEATSSLDSESEALIQDGLNALRAGRTTFVIAHRLSTIRNADQILVLEQGRIVERGRHEELLSADGLYRRLHDRQYKLEANLYLNPGETFGLGEAEHTSSALPELEPEPD